MASPTSPTSPTSTSTSAAHPESLSDVAASAPQVSGPPPNTRRCFVCLVDEPEAALPADWSTPCRCSLEGHQDCLLAWVTDLQVQGKDVKCPVCRSPIIITDRWDFAIQLNNLLHRVFSDWSPRILLGFIASSAVVTSSLYGAKAIDWFAGPDATMAFLINTEDVTLMDVMRQPYYGEDGRRGPPLNLLHFSLLPLIAPALILNRLRLGEVILIPTSLVYAALLDETTTEYVSWPPSPQRALALYPAVKATYFHLHNIISRSLERRWLAQSAKMLPADTMAQRQGMVEAPLPQPGNDAFDLRINIQIGFDDAEEDPQNNRQVRGLDPVISPINFITGALLYPSVCYGMGELLRLALPSRFITRPASGPNTSILQERWGRSLVGGCLFVVLKDVFFLWVKYRKIMNQPFRRIKNADNRNLRR
ncbi:hypothetical protein GGS23DRAFT_557884 [Durotheca rogersii]|uniref:uncharacterized protein n=1 Tax=Durotheca rogersii TaxID=419775 RepID=UPI00221FACBF|nr:uncharacterized protein GGS23DRAFT_557884 [Durotheca rogersii]KAI5865142.1 hypothetical protein GGS23DRAFT_557884 [Durotheca rogersii]